MDLQYENLKWSLIHTSIFSKIDTYFNESEDSKNSIRLPVALDDSFRQAGFAQIFFRVLNFTFPVTAI